MKYVTQKIKELHNKSDLNLSYNSFDDSMEVILRITKVCNERCVFCSTDLNESYIDLRDILLIISYLIESLSNKYRKITFCLSGGEPTLYYKLDKVIAFIVKKGHKVTLQTNACLFAKEDFLLRYKKFIGYISFFISLHAHNSDIYKQITDRDYYERAIIGINNLYKTFGTRSIELNHVISTHNFSSLRDYMSFVYKEFAVYGKVKLNISTLFANKHGYENYLTRYSDIVQEINLIHDELDILDKINICIDAGGYCQMPFCIFKDFYFVKNDLNSYGVGIDKDVGGSTMYKPQSCEDCSFNDSCLGISKKYYYKYGDNEIKPIIT